MTAQKSILLFPLLCLSWALLAAQPACPDWLNGKWEGTGYQIDGKQWEVSLELEGAEAISISYPDLACAGNWTLLKVENAVIQFREEITEGEENCDQAVEVQLLQLSDDTVLVKYYLRWYSDKPIAKAQLKRQLKS